MSNRTINENYQLQLSAWNKSFNAYNIIKSALTSLDVNVPSNYNIEQVALLSVPYILNNLGEVQAVNVSDAFTSRVTAGGLDIVDGAKADIESIEGKTQSFNQLINPANYSANKTQNNVTFTKQNDNSIKVVVGTGGATASTIFNMGVFSADNLINSTHKYLLKGSPTNAILNSVDLRKDGLGNDGGNGYIGTPTNYYGTDVQIYVRSGTPAGTYIFKPNLIDLSRNNDDSLTLEQAMTKYNQFYAYDSGSLKNSKVTSLISKNASDEVVDTITLNKELGSWHNIVKNDGTHEGITTSHVEVNEYDEVDLGTIAWGKGSASFYSTSLAELIKKSSNSTKGNMICTKYTTEKFLDVANGVKDNAISVNEAGQLNVKDTSIFVTYSGEQFKASLSGVMLRYQKNTTTYNGIDIDSYNAYKNGSETILNDNDVYGAIATLGINYWMNI